MPKYIPMTEQHYHQSALGQYGHGGGGHGHDWTRAEGGGRCISAYGRPPAHRGDPSKEGSLL
jgi:hypothetical protein